ncbi:MULTISPECIES: winged helix-turn-helix domain-containing protein [Providencia]|uniref:winged helix-turn-helix domain-containing protein n=1 Tax=Providencia TaxID=586 RepID=UPI0012B59926|nr:MULTISPECIES: helix-turn-helix domain-containing protein [Providencia]MTC69272.1 helix-turn-helix domain-containing protein [Providencia sp. wls1914]MTC74842.1 helix-turn-helix domain-containing protein [Providencia sp. wls1919]QLR05235.1 helix-turn-helix domain-containing protein [Providencia rettgeri]
MIEKHDYTIDNKFIFEHRTSRIFLKDDPDQHIELSKPAARLFGEILLLNLKKGIATRDELLTNVWEEYGLVGSNNNLNTYISEIRKKLELVGIDPKTIVTVPKKGFRIDSHLSSIAMDNDNKKTVSSEIITSDNYGITETLVTPSKSLLIPQNTELTKVSISGGENEIVEFNASISNSTDDSTKKTISTSEIIATKNSNLKGRMLLFSIISFILIGSFYLFINTLKQNDDERNSYTTFGNRDNCVFQSPIKMNEQAKKTNLDFINKKLNKYNISCEEPKRIIVLSDVNASYSFDKNAAISVCKEKNNKFDCVSINDQRI